MSGEPDAAAAAATGWWTRGRVLVVSLFAALAVAVGAWTWNPAFFAPLWANAGVLLPAATFPALCLYIGCPHKHRKLPSMDSFVVAATSSLVVLDALRAWHAQWGTGGTDKTKVIAPLIFAAAGLKALQRSFAMADEQVGEPKHK